MAMNRMQRALCHLSHLIYPRMPEIGGVHGDKYIRALTINYTDYTPITDGKIAKKEMAASILSLVGVLISLLSMSSVLGFSNLPSTLTRDCLIYRQTSISLRLRHPMYTLTRPQAKLQIRRTNIAPFSNLGGGDFERTMVIVFGAWFSLSKEYELTLYFDACFTASPSKAIRRIFGPDHHFHPFHQRPIQMVI
jgi:hypothetical protein